MTTKEETVSIRIEGIDKAIEMSSKPAPAEKTAQELADERAGLTTAEAEALYETVGYNELPHVEVSLYYLFFVQFTGLMPYVMEVCCILALAVQDWPDFAIVAAIVITNASLGFHEEMKAKASLDELTSKMEQKIAVLRDGKAENMLTRLLVPGDVILLVGGCSVPADVEWIEGDILAIDTAALTGEPLPRKYPSEDHGKLILAGCTVREGEAYAVVRKTGINTEVGGAQAEIMKDKSTTKQSVFEHGVLQAVKVICLISLIDVLIIFFVQGIVRDQFFTAVSTDILTCLSIMIAAVPVALPLVLQVTMALGAGKMAREFSAVVTSLPALQDISSMTILCSDKTGTLTTARISIIADKLWLNTGFTADDLALYGALASNRDKKEDAIDRSVIGFFDKTAPEALQNAAKEYTKTRSVGFNPIYKRVLWEYSHPVHGTVTIAKGLPIKVIDTEDGNKDDAVDQWKVEGFETLIPTVVVVDKNFSKAGYKTLGVSVKVNNGPFKFVGILPMLDPPRHDTAQTIKNLVDAGIRVKMCTGDHLNIAIETARLIGMGTNIQKGEVTRVASQTTNELIWDADGFAQVMPRDKREVVLVLRNEFKQVVGMTGDGVNDAPALSAAQCGIAVDDATDAAKNAAAIILTSPGLSAIYSAVVESRRIFRKLKSYVVYRFSATIQIVVVLTILIYVADCSINSLFIILLALFNDLSMLPVAYDSQVASAMPEKPNVPQLLIFSSTMGLIQTGLSLLWAFVSYRTFIFRSNFNIYECSTQAQGGVWVQLFLSTEWLIFITRSPNFVFLSPPPSLLLFVSVFLFCFLVSILACAAGFFGKLYVSDVAIMWGYNCLCFLVLDFTKMAYFHVIHESSAILPDEVPSGNEVEGGSTKVPEKDIEAPIAVVPTVEPISTRQEAILARVQPSSRSTAARPRSISKDVSNRSGFVRGIDLDELSVKPSSRVTRARAATTVQQGENVSTRGSIVVPHHYASSGDILELRRSKIGGSSLRPHTPVGIVGAKLSKRMNI